MKPCPNCKIQIQEWQTACHQCGHRNLDDEMVPRISEAATLSETVRESFQDWFQAGRDCLKSRRYEEAVACLQEALKRIEGVAQTDGPQDRALASEAELAVRSKLAYALEAAGKLVEARVHYEKLSEKTGEAKKKERLKKKTEELAKVAEDLAISLPGQGEFKPVSRAEALLVPLNCSGCHRLLSEAEVFGFRKQLTDSIRCVCGASGRPVARHDSQYEHALHKQESIARRKARLVEAVSRKLANGKKKGVAIILAIVAGGCGAHKFYLGDKAHSYIYSLWFLVLATVGVSLGGVDFARYTLSAGWSGFVVLLSLIPWFIAWFEVITYLQMSIVTFNLTYNLQLVRQLAPVDSDLQPRQLEVFSMDVSEDPEDYLDEWNETVN